MHKSVYYLIRTVKTKATSVHKSQLSGVEGVMVHILVMDCCQMDQLCLNVRPNITYATVLCECSQLSFIDSSIKRKLLLNTH